MAWGVENTTEDGIGQPWLGHERAIVAEARIERPEAGAPPVGVRSRCEETRPEMRALAAGYERRMI